jgi:hypothetical protein
MKKNLLLASLLLFVSMPLFAQGMGEIGEGITVLLAIIILAASILQIILFFKIWQMTDNVSRLKELKEQDKKKQINYNVEIKTSYLSGDLQRAKEIIYRKFFTSIDMFSSKDTILSSKNELKRDLMIIGEKVPPFLEAANLYGEVESIFKSEDRIKTFSLVKRKSDGRFMYVQSIDSDGKYNCAIRGIPEGSYAADEITKEEIKTIN